MLKRNALKDPFVIFTLAIVSVEFTTLNRLISPPVPKAVHPDWLSGTRDLKVTVIDV